MVSNIKHTTSAGGIVRKIENGKVYIVLNRASEDLDWLLPKGHVEERETIEQAAIREVKEETGLKNIKLVKKLGVKQRRSFEGDEYKTIHYFLFNLEDNKKKLPDKIMDGRQPLHPRWFPIDNLPKLFWQEQKEIIEENLGEIKKY